MLIIIEGPDKSGKSTLAHKIERLGFKYHHFSAPGPNPAREYADFLLNLTEPVVCDRFYVGERVYGPLLRKTSLLNDLHWVTLERLARSRGAVMIYANTPLATCQRRFKQSKQVETISLENNALAWKQFGEVILQSHISPRFEYDATDYKSLTRLVRQLAVIMPHRTELAQQAKFYCTGLGTILNKKLVIVGENLSSSPGWIRLPFAHGSASKFLLESLKEAKVPEELIYVTNADVITKKEVDFLRLDSETTWLSLGCVAYLKLKELNVKQYNIPHPSYWQRFHHHQPLAYVKMLSGWKELNGL